VGYGVEFILFMVFSIFESFAFFSLMFALYRIKINQYYWPILFISIISNVLSFVMRKEANLTDFVPLALLALLIMFMIVVVRIPIFWAFVVTLTGYFSLFILQTILMLLSFGYLSPQQLQLYAWKGYLLQLITSGIGYTLGKYLYSRGLGFAFMFERLQLRLGTLGLVIMIVLITAAFGTILFINNLYVAVIILFFGLAFLLYYALRKERADAHDSI
jgi:hypothetical protein